MMSLSMKVATVTLNPAIDQTVAIPNFAAGKVNRVESTQSDPGGKGVNVAWNLADYGFSLAVTGFLGEENASIFERLFAKKEIVDRFVRIAGSTRTGIKIVDEVTQETTDLNFPGQTPTAGNINTLLQTVGDLAADYPWFVLAGSIPSDADDGLYADLIKIIKARNSAVALDTSGEGLSRALTVGPTLVKPNIHELEEYVGGRLSSQADIIQAARKLLDLGIETVVVSMGEEGAIFVETGEVVQALSVQVTVKSTVGAGDAMVSGTVAGKVQGYSLAECAQLATAFSLVAITNVGAGIPSLDALETFRSQVTIKQLN